MASHFHSSFPSAAPRAAVSAPQRHHLGFPFSIFTKDPLMIRRRLSQTRNNSRIQVSDGGDLLQTAVDLESKSLYFQKIVENSGKGAPGEEEEVSPEALGKKTEEFTKILGFSSEERDKIQRMQVIDRAAAAISAARALLKENPLPPREASGEMEEARSDDGNGLIQKGLDNGSLSVPQPANTTPGPSFWAWTPPPDSSIDDKKQLKLDAKVSALPNPSTPVMEKERSSDYLSIPFESGILGSTKIDPLLPPLQSLVEVETPGATVETPQHQEEEQELGVQFSTQAAEAVLALEQVSPTHGVNPDGSKWWNETGTEQRPDGVLCKWTVTRGVSADKAVEWENKYWEAADEFGYKELGSEKSGRDAVGNVWREYWRESMSEIDGLVHMEKTADKWGKNGRGEEWQEQWWEKYDASGQAEKWAHKWCSIDPNTPLLAGHAHVWHERWGEKFDGQGGAVKYTDKWAERCEGDGWSKWGDKWDEHFDANGHGVKQGEKWWEGKHGDRWNRTWGEGHNGSGWVHKYGKSSSGEHWDTHARQDTWYERVPHFGFYHCFENSVQLREVKKPSESEES